MEGGVTLGSVRSALTDLPYGRPSHVMGPLPALTCLPATSVLCGAPYRWSAHNTSLAAFLMGMENQSYFGSGKRTPTCLCLCLLLLLL